MNWNETKPFNFKWFKKNICDQVLLKRRTRIGERKNEKWEQYRIGNEVTYRAWVQLRFCVFFFHFPIPVLVPRSPFPILVTSGREEEKCSKFKRKIKMRSQGKRCALYFRKNFGSVSIESQRTESKVTMWPMKRNANSQWTNKNVKWTSARESACKDEIIVSVS